MEAPLDTKSHFQKGSHKVQKSINNYDNEINASNLHSQSEQSNTYVEPFAAVEHLQVSLINRLVKF